MCHSLHMRRLDAFSGFMTTDLIQNENLQFSVFKSIKLFSVRAVTFLVLVCYTDCVVQPKGHLSLPNVVIELSCS